MKEIILVALVAALALLIQFGITYSAGALESARRAEEMAEQAERLKINDALQKQRFGTVETGPEYKEGTENKYAELP